MTERHWPASELSLGAQIESVLFVADRPLAIDELRRLLRVDRGAIEQALADLTVVYQQRGLALQRHGDAVQLVTHPRAAPLVQRFLGLQSAAKLSAAAVETLAVVAYRQPVTRAQIEAVRGVGCERALATLMARRLVEEVGRLETVGRPIVYGTTFEFLQAFGLTSLAELPQVEDLSPPGSWPTPQDDR